MRGIVVLLALGLFADAASAQHAGCHPQPPRRPGCAPCQQQCCPQPCPPREKPLAVPQGMYAQPPAVGEMIGESSALGFRGLAIDIPEIHLELPTLRLPNLIRYRRGPEMHVAPARAPYLTGQAATFGMMAPGGHALPGQLGLLQMHPRKQAEGPPSDQDRPPQPCPPNPCDRGNSYSAPPLAPPPEEVSSLREQVRQQQEIISELEDTVRQARECLQDAMLERQRELQLLELSQRLKRHEDSGPLADGGARVSRFDGVPQSVERSAEQELQNTEYLQPASDPPLARPNFADNAPQYAPHMPHMNPVNHRTEQRCSDEQTPPVISVEPGDQGRSGAWSKHVPPAAQHRPAQDQYAAGATRANLQQRAETGGFVSRLRNLASKLTWGE